MKNLLLTIVALISVNASAQINNTMYGLFQTENPSGFQFASIEPSTGQITPIGNAILSNMANATGSALNPYSQTFSYQDEDSYVSINLETGEVMNDVTLSFPNTAGYFDNFRFNAADSNMYGLFRQFSIDSLTGIGMGDIRLATCDLTTGIISLISPNSVAQSFTMSGSTIDPYQMVFYFETENKFMGLDLYNGTIYSEPEISLGDLGSSFDNFAYSCVDTSIYGLIMQNGVKSLGKINPQTGVVTALPTLLDFDNYVLNSGGAIDPENRIYYFQTIDSLGIKMVGLSLIDGSVTSESYFGNNAGYFILYRIQSDCYRANRMRLNTVTSSAPVSDVQVKIHPNPAHETLSLQANSTITEVCILDAMGKTIQQFTTHASHLQIPLETLNNGVYIVKLRTEKGTLIRRFIRN